MTVVRVPKRFCGLHAHTGASVFDGMGLPKEHFDFILENTSDESGPAAMAITEHGQMNSFCHAWLSAKDVNKDAKRLKYIPGVELYVHPDLAEWRRLKELKDAGGDDEENAEHGSTVENEEETKSNKHLNPISRKHHMVVLAKHSQGLEKLFSVVSRGFLEGFYKKPRVDYSWLKPFKGDFIASSACIGGPLSYDIYGEFPTHAFDSKDVEDPLNKEFLGPHLVDDPNVLERILRKVGNTVDRIVDAVGIDNFFLELQFNKLSAQHLTNRVLIELAKRTGIPLIATADSHYCRPEVWRERAIYQKLGWLNYTEYGPESIPRSVDQLKAELYPKNASQMWDSYKKTGPEAGYSFYDDQLVCDAIERTHDIAFQLIGDVQPDTSVKLPSWSVPKGKTAIQALTEACDVGIKLLGLDGSKTPWNLDHTPEEYAARLKYELEIIAEKKFSEYFLTMKAINDVASQHMLVGCGRGSAAGSLVNYVLGVTQVDPLKFGLIFERFINRSRVEYPDIDSDYADRDLLIKLLKDKFGNENVIPISNYNTFQLKSLIKDVARFFHQHDGDGLEFQTVNSVLTPLDDEVRKKVLKQGDDKNLFELKLEHCMGENLPDGAEPGPAMKRFKQFMEEHPEVYGPITVLLHENKSLGKHAGGVLVSERLPDRMPLIMSRKEPQSPWVEGMHFKHLNEVGFIKFDLLGLETLRIIQRCIELILKRHQGIAKPKFADVKDWYEKHLHPDVLDLNDRRVYECYEQGKFAGLFQFTAKGAQAFIKRVKPKNIVDIATATSIYRPGPLTAKVDNIYTDAKDDPGSVHYEHPLVKQVLEKTYGCIIFQEQLMELGNVVGGLSLEECDKLRKVITKRSVSGASKAKEEALKLEEKFIKGAIKQGVAEKVAKDLFEKMAFFSGYGFNASHAVSYAIDSYMCAWLLTYYEPEWLCAYMETQAGQPEKRAQAISELRSFGYEIVKVDINYATDEWTILPGKKFMPSFLTVKGIGDKAIEEVMAFRPYHTIDDLLWDPVDGHWRHSKFNKRAFENLIKLGAFDSMGIVGPGKTFNSYKQMHACLIEDNHKLKHKKNGRAELARRIKEQGEDEWDKGELVAMSKELVGAADFNLIISQRIRDKLEELNVSSIDDYAEKGLYWFMSDKAEIKMSKNNKPYLLITAMGLSGKRHRIYCWGYDPNKQDFDIAVTNCAYMSILDSSSYGYSTFASNVRPLDGRKKRSKNDDTEVIQ